MKLVPGHALLLYIKKKPILSAAFKYLITEVSDFFLVHHLKMWFKVKS